MSTTAPWSNYPVGLFFTVVATAVAWGSNDPTSKGLLTVMGDLTLVAPRFTLITVVRLVGPLEAAVTGEQH